eukprot:gene7506-8812_t
MDCDGVLWRSIRRARRSAAAAPRAHPRWRRDRHAAPAL